MKVTDIKPVANPGGGRMKLIAVFDLQLNDTIAINGMRLLHAPDGRHVSYAPDAAGGRRSVTFGHSLAAEITKAAVEAFVERVTANDRSNRKAA
jgi:DNA-binding cell septation regulator SpoVG